MYDGSLWWTLRGLCTPARRLEDGLCRVVQARLVALFVTCRPKHHPPPPRGLGFSQYSPPWVTQLFLPADRWQRWEFPSVPETYHLLADRSSCVSSQLWFDRLLSDR